MNANTEELFTREAWNTLNRLYTSGAKIDGIKWFFDLMYIRFHAENLRKRKPAVIALGEDVPAEILYAFSGRPLFITGGSLETARWADELTPRDTDPVSRSMLGWIENPCFDLAENAAIVMAASSDSKRKLASLLQAKGRKVFVLDVPPDRKDLRTAAKYAQQLMNLCAFLRRETGISLSRRRLWNAVSAVDAARYQQDQFLENSMKMGTVISPALRQMIAASIWFADDLSEWTARMKRLNAELRRIASQYYVQPDNRPRVLLVGSPVVFPNYKLPLLMEDSGLRMERVLDAMTIRTGAAPLRRRELETVGGLIRRIAERNLKTDASGAYVSNLVMQRSLQGALGTTPIDGIVCQILKGHVEVDFELPKLEEAAVKHGIPMIRLETDYQYQDVEQLRIRLEAFGEMLSQRRYEKEKIAR